MYRQLREALRPLLADLGLQPGQEMLLLAVGSSTPTQADVVDALAVGQPTVARGLKRLESSGHLVRVPDPEDGRATRLQLTESGLALVPKVQSIWRKADHQLLEPLSEEEAELFLDLANRIAGVSPGE